MTPAPFAGKIDRAREQSEQAWPQTRKAPAGAPNVVVILLDDVGFSAPWPFGGVAKTPTLERLAKEGVSYNEFHVTREEDKADNTPFQYGKGIPAYLGGARNPLVVSWPAKINQHGALRSQFTHVTDIAPTIYELTGIRFPDTVDGIRQLPLEGVSLADSFDNAGSGTAERRALQYFEIGGSRAIFKDGWWAGSRNLADRYPEKVAELAATFAQWA